MEEYSDFEILIPYKKIKKRTKKIAKQINHDFKNEEVVFLGVLNGSFMFISELFKHIKIKCQISFVKVASYRNTESTGDIKELIGINEDLEGKSVIIIEDIIDTGRTMSKVISDLKKLKPKKISIATLLVKPSKLEYNIPIDYEGFSIKDDFVIGFGLDYNGLHRNSKDILIFNAEKS